MDKSQKRHLSLKIKLYLLFWILIISLLVWYLYFNTQKYMVFANENKQLSSEIDKIKTERDKLTQELKYHDSDEFTEKYAREHLGMILPNEYIFHNDSAD